MRRIAPGLELLDHAREGQGAVLEGVMHSLSGALDQGREARPIREVGAQHDGVEIVTHGPFEFGPVPTRDV